MGKINFGRVLLGGLVAGLILNVGEWVLNDMVLHQQHQEFLKRCGFPDPGTKFLLIVVPLTFVLGIVIVLGYAAIRPRFGAGPKTAIIASLFAWFGVVVFGNIIFAGLGMAPATLVAMVIGWGLVEYLLATLVGAALYKEA